MGQDFQYDVFLSHSAKDNAVVRPLAERLRRDVLLTDSQPSTLNPQPACAPLNQDRRFIPLRLDDAPIKGPLPLLPSKNNCRHISRPKHANPTV
jgi:hypothetical protein